MKGLDWYRKYVLFIQFRSYVLKSQEANFSNWHLAKTMFTHLLGKSSIFNLVNTVDTKEIYVPTRGLLLLRSDFLLQCKGIWHSYEKFLEEYLLNLKLSSVFYRFYLERSYIRICSYFMMKTNHTWIIYGLPGVCPISLKTKMKKVVCFAWF